MIQSIAKWALLVGIALRLQNAVMLRRLLLMPYLLAGMGLGVLAPIV